MRDYADFFPDFNRVVFDVNIVDDDLSCSRAYEGGEYLDERGFSGAVRSEYCQEFTFFYFEIDFSKDNVGAECF
jgi:hypothetical protein